MERDEAQITFSVSIPKRDLRFALAALLALTLMAIGGAAFGTYVRAPNQWEPVPVGLDGYCPVTLCEKEQWRRGSPSYQEEYQGRRYRLAGPREQQRFRTDPERFSPVASGMDVVMALDEKRVVPGKRQHGLFFGGSVFLFANERSVEAFYKSPLRYAAYARKLSQGRMNE